MEGNVSLHIIELLSVGFVGVLMWIGKAMHNALHRRVEHLERSTAPKSSVDDLKSSMKEHREETRTNFQSVQTTLNAILLKVGGNHD